MFNFQTEVKESTNKEFGMGLFAKEFIPNSSIVWEFVEGIDIQISEKTFDQLKLIHKQFFKKYGWKEGNFIYSSCDLTNFINHSTNPNLICSGDFTIANKDIKEGEELFMNYQEFDDWFGDYKNTLK
jgi:SET domain-containing protein